MARFRLIYVAFLVAFLVTIANTASTKDINAMTKRKAFIKELNEFVSLVEKGLQTLGSSVKTLYEDFGLISKLVIDNIHSSVRTFVLTEQTQVPVVTTPHHAVKTTQPVATTRQPDVTTPQTARTTPEPAITTQQPDVTTPQPARTTPEPAITTQQPDVTTPQPARTTPEPAITTQQPDVTTPQPARTTPEPAITTQQPDVTTPQAIRTTTRSPVTTTPEIYITTPQEVVTTPKLAACAVGWRKNGKSLLNSCMCTQLCTFNSAREICRKNHAQLAACKSPAQEEFITHYMSTIRILLGGNDRDEEGTWRWPDGSLMNASYTHWAEEQPNGEDDENCLALNRQDRSEWTDESCTRSFSAIVTGFVCEKKLP